MTFVSAISGTQWLGVIAITGVVSAAIATADSLLLMTGAAIAHDLLRKCYYEPHGIVRDERFYLLISRITIVVVGVVSFVFALGTPELVLNIASYAVALVSVAFFFPMLFGLNSPYVSARAAMWSSVAGSFVGLVWTAIHLLYAPWTRAHIPWALDVHPVVPGLVAALIPILRRERRIEMSPAALKLSFPDRSARPF